MPKYFKLTILWYLSARHNGTYIRLKDNAQEGISLQMAQGSNKGSVISTDNTLYQGNACSIRLEQHVNQTHLASVISL